jgi:hypothetical protein
MARYQIITLVDITRSNPDRDSRDHLLLSRQANFNSLIQAIGLRSNVSWSMDPLRADGRLPSPFQGKATHWTWEFETEQEEVFYKDGDPLGLLKDDLDGVPVIIGLTESVDIDPQVFKLKHNKINTVLLEI